MKIQIYTHTQNYNSFCHLMTILHTEDTSASTLRKKRVLFLSGPSGNSLVMNKMSFI